MRFSRILLAGCLSLVSLPGLAETLTNLYQVREPVSGQSPDERTRATQAAVDTLVLRLTGDAKAAQGSAMAALRKDPQQIISQYGYEAGPPETLLVDFDPATTDRALRDAGLSIWGSNRPSILGWWLNDSVEGANLVGDGQAAAEPLRRAAQHRGLPLRLPLADLSEQGVGDAKTLEGTDPAPLKEASERYGADAILAVHAKEDAGQWQGKWRLWLGEQREQGTATGATSEALADAVLLSVSQRLAPRFVARPGASTGLLMQVQGMTLERYAQLLQLLDPFGVRLSSVEGDKVVFDVSGSADQLRSQLSLAKLQEVPASEAMAAAAAPVDAAAPVAPAAGAASVPAAAPAAAPMIVPASAPQLYFRW
ncbi:MULTISPECIES: DUF2066 domain-containing protein [Pseudomonas syringae group]|uniref:DUF2066 domain-containing protein n=1 Tax=Pseudomonas syringae pv. tomato TaxID=323 RepID=A0AAV1BR85_PSEUB|nr:MULTISPECIES: DUF2066 domain-containing protein [Pseudomonas syringae group]AVI85994.1 hypothetical protein XJ28_20965 [Pseudomonas syringae pv. tomato]EEB56920.1 conserved hypothetical protein [Pseudomonas syringae pv. tomato T1]KGK92362.1 hypothetical protein NB04_26965 [Pseudomonas syringae pv. tomato]KUR44220.1 hypothetical protein PSTA9_02714 [Pseudomonas syringae pv. tomato]KUR49836.1 hypothetical protein PST407_01871 [Pseudomonas syringae pv. tomato]